jgi:hypothetical protein
MHSAGWAKAARVSRSRHRVAPPLPTRSAGAACRYPRGLTAWAKADSGQASVEAPGRLCAPCGETKLPATDTGIFVCASGVSLDRQIVSSVGSLWSRRQASSPNSGCRRRFGILRNTKPSNTRAKRMRIGMTWNRMSFSRQLFVLVQSLTKPYKIALSNSTDLTMRGGNTRFPKGENRMLFTGPSSAK